MSQELDASIINKLKELLYSGNIDWCPNIQSRETGEVDLPDSLLPLFRKDQMETHANKRAITQFLSKYPEPKGGFLKPQYIDSQIHPSLVVKKRDEFYQELQGSILAGIRPLIALHQHLASLEDGAGKDIIMETINDSIKYIQHVASKLRIHRRITVARDLNFLPFSDAHFRIGSTDDSQLFGPELRSALEEERKAVPKGRPSFGNGPTGKLGKTRGLKWKTQTRRNNNTPTSQQSSQSQTQGTRM